MSLHVHEIWESLAAKVSTHVPRRVHSVATHMSLHEEYIYHFMYMNHQERTIKNVITAPPTPETPQKTPPPMTHEQRGPGPTSLCQKSNIKLNFMLHNIKVETCITKYQNVHSSGGPSSSANIFLYCLTSKVVSKKSEFWPLAWGTTRRKGEEVVVRENEGLKQIGNSGHWGCLRTRPKILTKIWIWWGKGHRKYRGRVRKWKEVIGTRWFWLTRQ